MANGSSINYSAEEQARLLEGLDLTGIPDSAPPADGNPLLSGDKAILSRSLKASSTPQELAAAYQRSIGPLLEEISAAGGKVTPEIQAKLDALGHTAEELKRPFIPELEGGLSKSGYKHKIPKANGLIDKLFKNSENEIHAGKLGAAIVAGAAVVAAVVGYFAFRKPKVEPAQDFVSAEPASKVQSVSTEPMVPVAQRQV